MANTFLNLHKPWRQSFTFCWVYYPFYTFILYLIKMVLMRENIRMFLSCLRWINHNAIKLFVKLTMLILLLHNILLPYQLYNFESWISTVEFLSCAICSNFFIVVKSICFIFLKRRESLLVGYDYFVRINKAACLSIYIITDKKRKKAKKKANKAKEKKNKKRTRNPKETWKKDKVNISTDWPLPI